MQLNLPPELAAKLIELTEYEEEGEHPESRALSLLEEAIELALKLWETDSEDAA